jgi:hypothetical protein
MVESIVNTIVTKLGYSTEEVKRCIIDGQHSFISVLYNKLLEE